VTLFIYENQKPGHVGKWVKELHARSLATAVFTSMAKTRRGNESCQDILCEDAFSGDDVLQLWGHKTDKLRL
jgi:hypothetical protein